MIALLIPVAILAIVFYFFSSRVSPIPYFPTNHKDLSLIIKTFKLKNNQVIFDLGAGDGTVLFKAASEAYNKNLDTVFVAIEINILLVAFLMVCRFFHPNKEQIHIIWGDMFKFDYNFGNYIDNSKDAIFYIYISPWFTERVWNLISKLGKPVRVISYFYPISSKKHLDKATGAHDIFTYQLK